MPVPLQLPVAPDGRYYRRVGAVWQVWTRDAGWIDLQARIIEQLLGREF